MKQGLLLVLAAMLAAARLSATADDTRAVTFMREVVGFSEAQIAKVEAGQVVTKQLPGADKPEIAAFGAVRVRSDRAAFLGRFRRDVGGTPTSPSVLEIGRFSSPPRVEDLAALTFDKDDLDAARQCEPGRCDIKLSRSAMERIGREVDWRAPNTSARATILLKEMLVEYTAAYLRGGTAEMATYADKDRPLDTATEFRKLLAASPYLVVYVPTLHRYLEEYPKAPLPGGEDVLCWWKDKFGPKPTISLYHVTIWPDPGRPAAVIAFKRIYASHYFQAGLELLAVVDAPGGGFYLMDFYRVRIDPPTGMLSGAILGKIRSGIEQGVGDSLKAHSRS